MKLILCQRGVPCKDKASGLPGVVSIIEIAGPNNVLYLFQPKGLNDAGEPLKGFELTAERLDKCPTEEKEVPVEIIGTVVTDIHTGFTGIATTLYLFETGCYHVEIQPKGLDKLKSTKRPWEVDLIRLEGPAIKKLTAAEKKQREKDEPGAMGMRIHTAGRM